MSSSDQVKRMADLLKSGATMLFKHCPQCNSPLFKINKDVWCPKCNKKVLIVKEGEALDFTSTTLLNDIEETILLKLQEVIQLIKNETDLSKIELLSNLLSIWLNVLAQIKNFRER